jgi:hypothetical protein
MRVPRELQIDPKLRGLDNGSWLVRKQQRRVLGISSGQRAR